MNEKAKIITVFGSSRPENGHADYADAFELGRSLATAGFDVCTGGYGGVMEAVSRGASEAGGERLIGIALDAQDAPVLDLDQQRAHIGAVMSADGADGFHAALIRIAL